MSQPTPYVKGHNLTQYATGNPAAPYNAAFIDSELAGIATSISEILSNLSKIQRDDNLLGNMTVHPESLSVPVRSLMVAGFNPRGQWATGLLFNKFDIVEHTDGGIYVSLSQHVAGVFATDYAAAKWMTLGKIVVPTSASSMAFSPDGVYTLTTNVQSALAEIIAHISTLYSNHSTQDGQISAIDLRVVELEADVTSRLDHSSADMTTNQTITALAAPAVVNFNTAGQINNNWNGTLKRFVAPTSGMYYLNATVYFTASTSGASIAFAARLLGSGGVEVGVCDVYMGKASESLSLTTKVFYMNAGEYVDFTFQSDIGGNIIAAKSYVTAIKHADV